MTETTTMPWWKRIGLWTLIIAALALILGLADRAWTVSQTVGKKADRTEVVTLADEVKKKADKRTVEELAAAQHQYAEELAAVQSTSQHNTNLLERMDRKLDRLLGLQ